MTNEEILLQGGDDMLSRLWDNNCRLIHREAYRWSKRNPSIYEDLVQSGFLAIAEAAGCYEPESGSFTTLLYYHIKKQFAICCAAFSGWSKRQWAEQQRTPPEERVVVDSLQRQISDDAGNATEIGDLIADPDNEITELLNCMERDALHSKLDELLAALDRTEEQTVRLRYYGERTAAQIEKELALSRAEYKRLYQSAFIKLRRMAARTELEDYIDRHTDYYRRVGVKDFQNTGVSAVERVVIKREDMLRELLYNAKREGKNEDNTTT